MYYIFLHTDLWTGKKNTKKKQNKNKHNLYMSQTHTQLHTDKKERKKHTFFSVIDVLSFVFVFVLKFYFFYF